MLWIPVGFLFWINFISYFLYSFFWVIRRRMKFMCRRFGTLCHFRLHRWYELFLALKSVYRPVFILPLSVRLVLTKRNITDAGVDFWSHIISDLPLRSDV